MAMQVKRLQDGSETWSTDGTCTSAEIKYLVLDATSKTDAIQAVLSAAPEEYGGLVLKEVRFESYENGNIELSAVYVSSGSVIFRIGGEEDPVVNFDCSGGTKHMTHALSQRKVYSDDESTDDDANCGIGWNGKTGGEAEFAGVDVPTADMRETYTKTISISKATDTTYKRKVAALVGKVNSQKFYGWEPGEIMFLGCSYSAPLRGARSVQVTYNFRIMPNEKQAVVSGKNCGSKKGFEYLWALSETVNDNGAPTVKTKAIYNSTVCESASFKDLGL